MKKNLENKVEKLLELNENEIKINDISVNVKENKMKLHKSLKQNKPISKLTPNKNELIKVKITPIPINKRNFSNDIKEKNHTYRNESKLISSSPSEQENLYNNTINDMGKMNNNESKNNKKEKYNNNYSTPYRRINMNSKREAISPSPNVIIKNFNYNNVYNINIDNEKNKKSKNKLFNNKDINRFAHKYITYNKPKTTSNMSIKHVISKKELDKIIFNDDKIKNNVNNKKEAFYSRFISERKYLKKSEDNLVINTSLNKGNNTNRQKSYKKIIIDNQSVSSKKNNLTECNKNNFNNNLYENDNITYSYNINTKDINNLNNSHIFTANNTYFKKSMSNTPKANNKYIKTENFNDNMKIISFNLKDLNLLEKNINNIVSNFENINSGKELFNECYEFINFYSNSTIKGIFKTFYKENNNKVIIESSINLSLFSIIIIYHLSKNNLLINDITKIIKSILFLVKTNFALYIKKIQLNYKINITKKNYAYFQSYHNFLVENNIINVQNESDITFIIYQNCKEMTDDIKLIMEYYKKMNTNYYNNFINIFNNISYKTENELLDYFNKRIAKKNTHNVIIVNKKNSKMNEKLKINHQLKKYRTNKNLGFFSPYKKNIFENLSIKKENSLINSLKLEKKEKMNKIQIPYIKNPSNKKYTLVLDLNKTLAYYNNEIGFLKLRNGLFSFLSMIKTYYELISFSCESIDIANTIIKEIESDKKYFDYNLNREHCIVYDNNLVKDISLIGRDISKVIIIDHDENCFKLNKDNGIKIASFDGNNKNDNILFELKKILILIYKKNYDDIRFAIKEFSNDIKNMVSLA